MSVARKNPLMPSAMDVASMTEEKFLPKKGSSATTDRILKQAEESGLGVCRNPQISTIKNRPMCRVGVDLAGADVDQSVLFEACQEAVVSFAGSLRCYSSVLLPRSSIECVLCSEVIHMDDDALSSVRCKRQSSLVRSMCDLSSGDIDALVTCAHTGAVTAAAVLYVKRFPGLHRPALLKEIPTLKGVVIVLDVGAFVEARASDLFSYAILGSAFARICGIEKPSVGLLNIGRERNRGTKNLQEADAMLRQCVTDRFHYSGNIEPLDAFSGSIHVLVTSGFAGNIFLKTAEGVAHMFSAFTKAPGGALLAGVNAPVLKCHGNCSKEALIAAIVQAGNLVTTRFVPMVAEQFRLFERM